MFESIVDGYDTAGLVDPAAAVDLPRQRLAELIAVANRAESVLIARRLGAIAALLRSHGGADIHEIEQDHESVTGYERTCAEVSALMNLSPATAGYQVHYAAALADRLPRVGALFAAGCVDWRTVRLIITRTDLVDDGLIAGLDEHLAGRVEHWQSWSQRRVINAVDAAVVNVDADAARQRRKDADDDRYIWISPERDGMARLDGKLAGAQAVAFDKRLTELAGAVCAADPRNLEQRRADALAAMAGGQPLTCACERSDCPARAAEAPSGSAGARVILNVIATADTVSGAGDSPGYLDGYGVIDADQVRELAVFATQRTIDATVDSAAALRYRPSAALARAVRCRDLTCRFPGCHRRAVVCDLDHTVPFNHDDPTAGGLTTVGNLKCLCRFHHRMKTFGGWSDRQLSDGTVIWTSPTGKVFRTSAGCADILPELGDALSATDQRPLPQRCRSRKAQRAYQIRRIRRENRSRRDANDRHAARCAEIEARRHRNRMRKTLSLLKGTRSTSPFCAWVNEPPEPEELAPDWTPPPVPSPPEFDDPPF